jgi:hypothetical protein
MSLTIIHARRGRNMSLVFRSKFFKIEIKSVMKFGNHYCLILLNSFINPSVMPSDIDIATFLFYKESDCEFEVTLCRQR